MREIILNHIKALQNEKQTQKIFPSEPNEFELKQELTKVIDKALNELITEGVIAVDGITGNKYRILKT